MSAGNDYLARYVRRYNQAVFVNPTTIDTKSLANYQNSRPDISSPKVTIGWTGTHSTMEYLQILVPVLEDLAKEMEFSFLVIANRAPEFSIKNLYYIPWNKETEIEDLTSIDIGVMPMPDKEWTQSKCGFKALQFMALGIPVLASPVGMNSAIIDDGTSGILCRNQSEWKEGIKLLANDHDIRKSMGVKALTKVENHYSVNSNLENFLRLFK